MTVTPSVIQAVVFNVVQGTQGEVVRVRVRYMNEAGD